MHPHRIGSLTVDRIEEMSQNFPLLMGFADATASDLAALKAWYKNEPLAEELESAQLALSVHSFVLRSGRHTILIDSCNGNDKAREVPFANMLNSNYLERLAQIDLQPRDIDLVLCTHLHCDHVGWNTRLRDGRWVPTFPNARYLFGRADVDFFASHPNEFLHSAAFADSVRPVLDAGQADLVDTGHVVEKELAGGVWLESASGHSPGSYVVHAQSGDHHGIFSGDVFHHPLQLARPSLSFIGDFDVAAARETRRQLFEKHADTATVFYPAHFAAPTAGRIASAADGFRYEFIAR